MDDSTVDPARYGIITAEHLATVRAKLEEKPRLKDQSFYYTVDSLTLHRMEREMHKKVVEAKMRADFEHDLVSKVNSACFSCPGKEVFLTADYAWDRKHLTARCSYGPMARCPDQFKATISREDFVMRDSDPSWDLNPFNSEGLEPVELTPEKAPLTTADMREDFGSW